MSCSRHLASSGPTGIMFGVTVKTHIVAESCFKHRRNAANIGTIWGWIAGTGNNKIRVQMKPLQERFSQLWKPETNTQTCTHGIGALPLMGKECHTRGMCAIGEEHHPKEERKKRANVPAHWRSRMSKLGVSKPNLQLEEHVLSTASCAT